jgi:hypothetical protein
MTFDTAMSGLQRKKVHNVADYLACLEHISIGRYPNRFIKACWLMPYSGPEDAHISGKLTPKFLAPSHDD